MKTNRRMILGAAITLLFLTHQAHAELLTGIVKGGQNPTELTLEIPDDGDPAQASYKELRTDAEGHVQFDSILVSPACDIKLYIGQDLFGAHLENGENLHLVLQSEG